jgi:hypothetical protein
MITLAGRFGHAPLARRRILGNPIQTGLQGIALCPGGG